MTAETRSVGHGPPPIARARERAGSGLARMALLVCWVALLVYLFAFGERESSLGRLEQSLQAGQVHSVTVGPPGVPAGRGYGWQQVHWREGHERLRADVTMSNVGRAEASGSDGAPVREGRDVAAHLRGLTPDLDVRRTGSSAGDGEIYGRWIPHWPGVLGWAVVIATLALLITGPPTWRATKWAWFWLMATPVGLLAYLMLSGPTLGLSNPRSERPSLRGGWAFVIALVSASILPSWWH